MSTWAQKAVEAIPSTLDLWHGLFGRLKLDDRILDIGCGFGTTVAALRHRGYANTTGIDVNAAAIEAAKRIAATFGFPAGMFQVADARRTGLPDGSFDAAILQAVLCILEEESERAQALAEAARVLVPGGAIYVADFLQAWHLDLYRARYVAGERAYGEAGTFDVAGEDGAFLYKAHHFTEREITEMLRAAGFGIEAFEHRRVTTRSGNSIWGFAAIGRRLR